MLRKNKSLVSILVNKGFAIDNGAQDCSQFELFGREFKNYRNV
jgi:hypothetical protein